MMVITIHLTPEQIKAVLENHQLWLNDNGGTRANLEGANLIGANLGEHIIVWEIGPLGSRGDSLNYIHGPDRDEAHAGCWSGTLDEFEKQVLKTHGDNKYAKQYQRAIAFLRAEIEAREVQDVKSTD